MSNCSYCGTTINDQYNFCVNCEKQVKCISCGDILLPNKSICLKCGKPVISTTQSTGMNEFVLEESQTRSSSSRKVKGTLSDTAITQVASLLARASAPFPTQQPRRQKLLADGQGALPFEEPVVVSAQEEVPTAQSPQTSADTTLELQLKKYFTVDGKGSLVARAIDFKGKNKKEQQIRFMLLFVAAFNAIYNKPLPQQKLIFDALKSNNMLDINAKAAHFKFVETNYLVPIDGSYALKLEGEKEVERIIAQMNTDTTPGFTDWGKSSRQRGKQSRIDQETIKKVAEWIDMDPKIGSFDTRALKTPTRYAMFGIYLLTKALGVAKAAQYQVVHEYLSKKYTIPVTKDAMRKAFIRPTNAGRFEKASDGGFFLTQSGEEEVKGWLEGKPFEADSEK